MSGLLNLRYLRQSDETMSLCELFSKYLHVYIIISSSKFVPQKLIEKDTLNCLVNFHRLFFSSFESLAVTRKINLLNIQ